MSRLSYLTAEEMSGAQRELFESIRGGKRSQGPKGGNLTGAEGGLVGPFNAWLYSPEVGSAIHRLGEAVRFGTSLKPNLLELAVLVVGREWSAQFEWWAHARYALRDGVAESVVEAIKAREEPEFDDPEEATVHAFCRELMDTRRVSDATYRRAIDLLGESGVVELIGLLGYYGLVSMTLNVFRVPVPPGQTPPFEEPAVP